MKDTDHSHLQFTLHKSTCFLVADRGEKVEAKVDTGVTFITKENMDNPRSLELLNPKLNE